MVGEADGVLVVGGGDPRGMMCGCYMVGGENGERDLRWMECDEGKRRGAKRGRGGVAQCVVWLCVLKLSVRCPRR
jgi:hypothetical protein